MLTSRRRVLTGLLAAPAVIRTPGLLMPTRSLALDPSAMQIRVMVGALSRTFTASTEGTLGEFTHRLNREISRLFYQEQRGVFVFSETVSPGGIVLRSGVV